MTLDDFQRAQLAAFAFRQAGGTGSVASMKAVCYVMANRVVPWHGGDWLAAIAEADRTSAHSWHGAELSVRNALLLGLLRDIDDVFFGSSEEDTRKTVGKCLYWSILGYEVRPWFRDNIVRMPDDHPRRAQVGTVMLYE